VTPGVVEGLAQWLAARGHGAYRRGTAYLDGEVGIVLGGITPAPAQILALTPYVSGAEPDSRLPFDEVPIQARRRGTGDESVSRDALQAVYDDLQGLGPLLLPNDCLLQLVVCATVVTPLGRDEAGRHEHTFNLRAEYHNPTAQRPAL
jgi:hypothetical protein